MVVTILGCVQVLICIVLIFLVLMHSGKDARPVRRVRCGHRRRSVGRRIARRAQPEPLDGRVRDRVRSQHDHPHQDQLVGAPHGRRWPSCPPSGTWATPGWARRRALLGRLSPHAVELGEDLDRLGSQRLVHRGEVGVREFAGAMVELGVADLSVLRVARRLELGELVEAGTPPPGRGPSALRIAGPRRATAGGGAACRRTPRRRAEPRARSRTAYELASPRQSRGRAAPAQVAAAAGAGAARDVPAAVQKRHRPQRDQPAAAR